MNWNKILIVYSKWILMLSRFIVLFVVVLAFVNGEGFGGPNVIEIDLGVQEKTFGSVEDLISVNPEYHDRVESIESYGGSRRLNIKMDYGVFTGTGLQLIIKTILVIAFLHVLLQIIKSAEAKEFFNVKNVFRIRLIGFGLIGWAIFEQIFIWYTSHLANKYLVSDYLEATRVSIPIVPDIFGNTFVIGLIVLIVAQAFDHGLKLEKEQELTI